MNDPVLMMHYRYNETFKDDVLSFDISIDYGSFIEIPGRISIGYVVPDAQILINHWVIDIPLRCSISCVVPELMRAVLHSIAIGTDNAFRQAVMESMNHRLLFDTIENTKLLGGMSGVVSYNGNAAKCTIYRFDYREMVCRLDFMSKIGIVSKRFIGPSEEGKEFTVIRNDTPLVFTLEDQIACEKLVSQQHDFERGIENAL